MGYSPEFEEWRERQRKAEVVGRRGAATAVRGVGGSVEDIRVRRGAIEDVREVSRLMELNGLPRSVASEEAFLVAEAGGEVLAALEYRFGKRRLLLGTFAADPFVEARPLAEALYREACIFICPARGPPGGCGALGLVWEPSLPCRVPAAGSRTVRGGCGEAS